MQGKVRTTVCFDANFYISNKSIKFETFTQCMNFVAKRKNLQGEEKYWYFLFAYFDAKFI